MNGARKALLRRPAIGALAIVKKVDGVEATDPKGKMSRTFHRTWKTSRPRLLHKADP